MKLTKWTAKRAGGRITVTGQDDEGNARKIVGIESIGPQSGGFGAAATTRIIARDKNGGQHELALS